MKIEKLSPAFKDYIWGGEQLKKLYDKQSDLERLAESWELSVHPDGQSVLSGGEYDGMLFGDYLKAAGKEALGSNCAAFADFPVLIKFIDAKQPLSIQVHPSDAYAQIAEKAYGKTEMWYVMDCEPGAFLYFGVNQKLTKEEFKQRIEDNTVLEVLNKVPVKQGDVFFIEAGTLHAIGAGILICEIQQNSNITYRVYDYGRKDADGNLRQLHIDKALDVTDLEPVKQKACIDGKTGEGWKQTLLASCDYFTVEKLDIETGMELVSDSSSFLSLIALSGTGRISGAENEVAYKKGDSIFVPANSGKITVTGPAVFVKTSI